MPELGYRPVNKYLPPRPRRDRASRRRRAAAERTATHSGSLADRFFAWVDRTLSR